MVEFSKEGISELALCVSGRAVAAGRHDAAGGVFISIQMSVHHTAEQSGSFVDST